MSKTAVSFAFNDPGRLAKSTALHIRQVADALGYRPDPVARMLSRGETRTIGLLTPQALSIIFSNPFFATFCEGVAFAAEESGFALYLIAPLHGSLAGALSRATVDGVVAIGLSHDHPDVEQIQRAGLPIVLVDSTALPDHSSIAVDDERGARAAAEHLIELGHRRVLVLGVDPPEPWSSIDPRSVTGHRLKGYRVAFADVGAAIRDDRVVFGPASIQGGITAIDAAWPDRDQPTAVLAMSDAMAIGAMRALRDRSLRIPGDVSVVGFDDLDLAQHVEPALTTVHQPIRRKGEEAVRLLLSGIGRHDQAGQRHVRLEAHLIVRDSTGPPASR